MFDSKFTAFVVLILIVCIVLVGYMALSDNPDADLNESSDDVAYIWMEDENGNIQLTPTTHTHAEGSGSAPG